MRQKRKSIHLSCCENYFCQTVESLSQNPEINQQIQEGVKSVTNFVVKRGSELLLLELRNFFSLMIVIFFIGNDFYNIDHLVIFN